MPGPACRRSRLRLAGDDAKLRHLQRLELDLDSGELLAKAYVFEITACRYPFPGQQVP